MDLKYWENKWLYDDIGFNQSRTNLLLTRYYHKLELLPESTVLIPLCGKSIDMIFLSQFSHNIIGVEVSQAACKAFFVENNLQYDLTQTKDFTVYESELITLYAGDFFKLKCSHLGKVDAVYDRAALVALPSSMRHAYLKQMRQMLTDSARILLITTSYSEEQMQGPPFSIDDHQVSDLYYKCKFKSIETLYCKKINRIPENLLQKGLHSATEHAFLIA